MGRVAGKVALISGGARNIGAASARMLVAEGAKVVIGDLLDEEGHALAAELGDAARYVHLDVTQEEDWTSAVAFTLAEFGKLDVLFNNAGIFNGSPLQRFKLDRWQQMLDICLTGPFLGMKAAADAMIAAGGGSIINTSSIDGLRGTPWAHGYIAAKWGLRGLTKSVALELAQRLGQHLLADSCDVAAELAVPSRPGLECREHQSDPLVADEVEELPRGTGREVGVVGVLGLRASLGCGLRRHRNLELS